MALTCSHKILKAHSYEGPGRQCSSGHARCVAGKPPRSERVRRRFFSPLHRFLWLSARQQRSILKISSRRTQTHSHMRQSNLMPPHESTNKKYQHGYTDMNFTPLLQSCMNNQTDSSTLTFTWSGLCGDAVFLFS